MSTADEVLMQIQEAAVRLETLRGHLGSRFFSPLLGMLVYENCAALTTAYEVRRWPTHKKRRAWQVIKVQRPAVFILSEGHACCAHPELATKLRTKS